MVDAENSTPEQLPEAVVCAARFTAQYAALREQYPSIPTLAAMDESFETMDYVQRERISTPRPLRLSVGLALRWVNGWMGTLHDLLMPNQQNAIALQEASNLTESDREQVQAIINWMMYRNRTWTLLIVERDEASEVEFLGSFHTEWLARREAMKTILGKVRSSWEDRMQGKQAVEKRPDYTS